MRNDVLGQGDEPVPAVGRTVRFRTIPRPLLELTASELLLLFLLFFPGISAAQESPDPPLNHAQSERRAIFQRRNDLERPDGRISQRHEYVSGTGDVRGGHWLAPPPVQLSAYDGALELRGHTGVHAVVPRRKRTDLSLRWRRGVGFGFRATQKMARSAAVYRRELSVCWDLRPRRRWTREERTSHCNSARD